MDKYYFEEQDLEVELKQQPYIDGVIKQDAHFKAIAKDVEGFDYLIIWQIKENWDWVDDTEACDWENPIEIKLIGKY